MHVAPTKMAARISPGAVSDPSRAVWLALPSLGDEVTCSELKQELANQSRPRLPAGGLGLSSGFSDSTSKQRLLGPGVAEPGRSGHGALRKH